MRPKEVKAFLVSILQYKDPPPVFMWGPPGVGKSDVAGQAAEEEGVDFCDMRLTLNDPTDLKGLPVPDREKNRALWLPFSGLPKEGRGILLLDELNLAPPLVQSAAYQLVLNKKVGEYTLSHGWRVVAAGNKTEHQANVYRMAAPLRNRFVHIEFEYHVDDWREWAVKNSIASEVVEFISFREDLLFNFDPQRSEEAFATPRTWEFVSKILQGRGALHDTVIMQAIRGTVGEGAATEFAGYLELRSELPKIEEILRGRNYKPKKIDIACALATTLVMKANSKQFDRLLEYADTLQEEVSVLMAKLMLAKDKEAVQTCSRWPAWIRKHQDLIVEGLWRAD